MATKTKERPTIGMSTEFITPEIAAEYISKEKMPTNRNLVQRHVDRLVYSMETGQWLEATGQPIIFNDAGHLIDGQHRMWALIETGQSHHFQVMRGLPSETIWVLDTGKSRGIPDFLSMAGEKNCNVLGAAINAFYYWETTNHLEASGSKRPAPTSQDAFRILEAHPGLRESTIIGNALNRAIRGGAGRWAAIYYILAQIDQEDADDFVHRATYGDNLQDTHPIFLLRKRFLENILTNHKIRPGVSDALILKAWNMYRRGETAQKLQWRAGGARPEPYPQPI